MHNKRTTNGFVAIFSFYTGTIKKIASLFFCLIISGFAQAELSASDFTISAYANTSALQQSDDINEVSDIINSDAFVPLNEHDNPHNDNSWLKIQWDKNKINNEQFFMNNGLSVNFSEKYYLIKDNKIIAHYSTDLDEPFSTRPIEHFKFVFDVKQADYILAKICCNAKFSKFFRLLSTDELYDDYFYKIIKYAIFYALIAAFIIYNFFIWLYLRDKKYFWYCTYLSAVLLGLLSLSGIGKLFFWSDASNLHFFYYNQGPVFTILGAAFIISFLKKQFISRRTFQLLLTMVTLQIIAAIVFLGAFIFFRDNFPAFLSHFLVVIQMLTRIGLLVNIYIILRSFVAGDKTAKLLLFSYGVVNVAVVILILRSFYLVPDNSLAEFGMEIAIVTEALLLSLAMAQNIQELKNQKLATEKKKLQLQEAFSWQLIEVQENEKRQIGKILQDNFNHQLLILRNSILKKIGAGQETKKTEDIIDEIRDLSSLYHPYILENLGLEEALLAFIEQIEKKNEIDINFAYNDCKLPHQERLVVFRIIQDSLNNIVKNARADECVIAIDCEQNFATILIKDDGNGYNIKEHDDFGFKIIKERCKQLSGTIDITSDDMGTNIKITFLVSHSQNSTQLAT